MSHYGPLDVTQDITGWSAGQLADWIRDNPDWQQAAIRACTCEICGEVVELVRRSE